MATTLHLRAVQEDQASETSVEPVFFVLQRANGHWSPAAKIMGVYHAEIIAELEAARLKKLHPQQAFGVAALRSEAREVIEPIEIVRVVETNVENINGQPRE